MDPEQISLIVLICMTALLLFQKKIFLFLKGVYERSKKICLFLMFSVMITSLFLSISFIFYYPEEGYSYFVTFSIFIFVFMFFYKIAVFFKNFSYEITITGKSSGTPSSFFIIMILFFFSSLINGLSYLLSGDPSIFDVGITTVIFINWLDFNVRLFRWWRKVRIEKNIGNRRVDIWEWLNQHPGYNVKDYKIDPVWGDEKSGDLDHYKVTLDLIGGETIHLKIKRHSLWNWGVDEGSVAIVKGKK